VEVGKCYSKCYKCPIGHVIKVTKIIPKDTNYNELPSAVFDDIVPCAVFDDIVPCKHGWSSPCPISWMDDYEEAPKYNSPLWKAIND
jgi:hypothetical protein